MGISRGPSLPGRSWIAEGQVGRAPSLSRGCRHRFPATCNKRCRPRIGSPDRVTEKQRKPRKRPRAEKATKIRAIFQALRPAAVQAMGERQPGKGRTACSLRSPARKDHQITGAAGRHSRPPQSPSVRLLPLRPGVAPSYRSLTKPRERRFQSRRSPVVEVDLSMACKRSVALFPLRSPHPRPSWPSAHPGGNSPWRFTAALLAASSC